MSHHAVLIHRDDMRKPQDSGLAVDGPPSAFDEMPGHSEYHGWHGIRAHCKRFGAGEPLVLVHAVDVGASCIEWRRNTPALAEAFATYSIDLPGFGLSGMPEEAPRAALYVKFLSEFLERVRSEHGKSPSAVGSGAGAAYLATVAREKPDLVSRMILVAPTGISACKPNPLGAVAFQALRLPGLRSLAANGASRTSILEHLRQEVYGDDAMAGASEVDVRYYVAHRPGSGGVERARQSGLLNVNLRATIEGIKSPTLVAWGAKAVCPPAADAEVWRELHPGTPIRIFEKSGLCPHFEEPAKFNEMAMDYIGWDRMAKAA